MKKVLALVVATMVLAGAYAAQAKSETTTAGNVKIGYVDMNQSINEVKAGRSAKAKLEADGKAKKQKLEIMQNELKKMKEDLDKQSLILSKDALQEKQAAFQQKFMELQRTTMEFEREFAEKEQSLIKPITEKLARVIQDVAREKGYTLIVPKAMVLSGLQQDDLTGVVIKKFDSSK